MSNTDQERRAQLEALLAKLRPAVQADGGDLYLTSVDTDSGKVVVGLSGACSSCAISTTTVKLGVERILKASSLGLPASKEISTPRWTSRRA